MAEFINRHYRPDTSGNWIFSNGPQRVYVALDYVPLVFRLAAEGVLTAHTGSPVGSVANYYLDDEGNALFDTDIGIGLLDDRDLAAFLDTCLDAGGAKASDETLHEAISGAADLFWQGIPLKHIRRCDIASRFGFQADPQP